MILLMPKAGSKALWRRLCLQGIRTSSHMVCPPISLMLVQPCAKGQLGGHNVWTVLWQRKRVPLYKLKYDQQLRPPDICSGAAEVQPVREQDPPPPAANHAPLTSPFAATTLNGNAEGCILSHPSQQVFHRLSCPCLISSVSVHTVLAYAANTHCLCPVGLFSDVQASDQPGVAGRGEFAFASYFPT